MAGGPTPTPLRPWLAFCVVSVVLTLAAATDGDGNLGSGLQMTIERERRDHCAAHAVGRLASTDGSTMITHTDDMGFVTSDLRLVRTPARDYPVGAVRPVYAFSNAYPRLVAPGRSHLYHHKAGQNRSRVLGYIPQVAHTFGYWETDYGMMNEHQLAMGESTCGSKAIGPILGDKPGQALFEVEELTRVALERCTTARCAIATMGGLATTYGYSTMDRDNGDSAEGLAIADGREAWIFHVMPSPIPGEKAIWVAQRVPDDEVAVVANMFVIRRLRLGDPDMFLASPNVMSAALTMGWWDGKAEFDFTAAYAYVSTRERNGSLNLYSARRIWRSFDLLAPSRKLDPDLGHLASTPTYPFSIKPDNRVAPAHLMRIMRDHYEGTKFDLTVGPAAGPFGNPVRYTGGDVESSFVMDGNWEYSLSLHRTIWSFICVSRADVPGGGVLWHALDSPHGSVYMPFFAIQNDTPRAWYTGIQSQFSRESAYWAFNFVNNWISLRYNLMIKDVNALQSRLERTAEAMVDVALQEAAARFRRDPEGVTDVLERAAVEHAEWALAEWWALGDRLIAKYSSGYVTAGEGDRVAVGYPRWWLCQSGTFFNFPHGMTGAPAHCPLVPTNATATPPPPPRPSPKLPPASPVVPVGPPPPPSIVPWEPTTTGQASQRPASFLTRLVARAVAWLPALGGGPRVE